MVCQMQNNLHNYLTNVCWGYIIIIATRNSICRSCDFFYGDFFLLQFPSSWSFLLFCYSPFVLGRCRLAASWLFLFKKNKQGSGYKVTAKPVDQTGCPVNK